MVIPDWLRYSGTGTAYKSRGFEPIEEHFLTALLRLGRPPALSSQLPDYIRRFDAIWEKDFGYGRESTSHEWNEYRIWCVNHE